MPSKRPKEISAPVAQVLLKLDRMREQRIWPNGMRYLWTDAFGVVLLVSLYRELEDEKFLNNAERVVEEVERVLGRPRGLRIGEAADRDGQYFHYLAMWIFALSRLGGILPRYRTKAIRLVKDIHSSFVIPGRGVKWKMLEDLSAAYPGFGLGALDAFHGYVVYRLLDETALDAEIQQMDVIIERSYRDLVITQDLGLGMLLWMTHFFAKDEWARVHRERLGLQALTTWPDRVARLNTFFETYRSRDHYDTDAITHVMACISSFPGNFILKSNQCAF